jgi:hypothetical protein
MFSLTSRTVGPREAPGFAVVHTLDCPHERGVLQKERPDCQLPRLISEHVGALEILIDALAFSVREILNCRSERV